MTSSSCKQITVMTADDHPLIRQGLAALLADEKDIVIVGEASDGHEAVAKFDRLRPDILLLDLQMPNLSGLDALAMIKERHANARVIVLTTYDTEQLASKAVSLGAQAYLLKDAVARELVDAIRGVYRGQRHLSAQVATTLAAHVHDQPLSPREISVLSLIAFGNSNRAVGATLSITEDTVKGYVKNILVKLDAKDRTHAVAIALKRGIIEL